MSNMFTFFIFLNVQMSLIPFLNSYSFIGCITYFYLNDVSSFEIFASIAQLWECIHVCYILVAYHMGIVL